MENLDFDVSDQSGYIIVHADSVECLRLKFENSIHVQVIFSSSKDSFADPNDSQNVETVIKCEPSFAQELMPVVSNKDEAESEAASPPRTTKDTGLPLTLSKASTDKSHSQEEQGEEEMRCNLCGKTFVYRKFYLMHGLRAHVKICKICKASFETKAHLKRHIREQHLEDKDADGNLLVKQCAECPYKTLSAKNFNRHLQRGHNKNPTPFACEYCPRTYSRKSYYLLHIKNEHSNDPTTGRKRTGKLQERLPCDVCGKLFKRKFLANHLLYHGPKMFKCNNCPKAFSELHGLKRHMLTHTKEKPYQCEVCSKCFSQSTNLTIHMRTHTKEKPFQCQFCDLAFSHKCTLQGHIDRKHKT